MTENATETTETTETQLAPGGATPPSPPEGVQLTAEQEDVLEAMRDVVDPELGINVVDLGLVYGVDVDAVEGLLGEDPRPLGVDEVADLLVGGDADVGVEELPRLLGHEAQPLLAGEEAAIGVRRVAGEIEPAVHRGEDPCSDRDVLPVRFEMGLVEGVQDYAIFMLSPSGHVLTWNAGAERIKGYRAGEIIGQHFSCFFTPEELAGYRACTGRTASGCCARAA